MERCNSSFVNVTGPYYDGTAVHIEKISRVMSRERIKEPYSM